MNKNERFVWDPIVNDPARHKETDRRIADENRRRAEREERLCRFHQASAKRKRIQAEVQACRYATGALFAAVVTYFIGHSGINWLAWILGAVAAALAAISCFGFGRVHEMSRNRERAASRSSSPESGMQGYTYTDNLTEEEDEVNAE